MEKTSSLLDVDNLSVDFKVDGSWNSAVDDVSFSVEKGEIVALVGESGCGKSVTCMSLAKLLPVPPARYSGGEINFTGNDACRQNIFTLKSRSLRKLRGGKIAYIFQEPSVSLNPVFKVGDQIAESIRLHRPEISNVKAEIISLLELVGIPEPEARINSYPHEMSGGMQQRVMIAMALASKPELLVADEPTTALDVTIQAQILDLIRDLRDKTNMAVILVTHNLGIVAELADKVIVMYAGNTMESSSATELITNPLHPYTRALLAAVPKLGQCESNLTTIPGSVPLPVEYPTGCRFFGRCKLCEELNDAKQLLCEEQKPKWDEKISGHFCRCHHV